MFECIKQLMILQSAKLFYNNYTMRVIIKEKKIFINKLQIIIDEIIYMQKLRLIYSLIRNINAIIYSDLKKYYIQPGQLFYSKKLVLILFTYPFIKVINFLLLYSVIYLVKLKQNSCAFCFLYLLLKMSDERSINQIKNLLAVL